jgi:hypothetical protein
LHDYLDERNLILKVRQAGRIVSVAVIIAVGVNDDGRREVLGMTVGASEADDIAIATGPPDRIVHPSSGRTFGCRRPSRRAGSTVGMVDGDVVAGYESPKNTLPMLMKASTRLGGLSTAPSTCPNQ